MAEEKLIVLVCGSGNGAHVMAGVASSQPGVEARVFTLTPERADSWTNAMKDTDFVVSVYDKGELCSQIKSKPSMVTSDPSKCAPGCQVIALVVPAFRHAVYIKSLKPYIEPGTIIVGLPGQTGLEFCIRDILGDLAKQCTLLTFETLPWFCRIKNFGQEVDVKTRKLEISGSSNKGGVTSPEDAKKMLQRALGQYPVLKLHGHMLGTSLSNVNACLHAAILYGQWHDWDGTPVDANPLFYHGASREAAAILSGISDEIVATAKVIAEKEAGINLGNVCHIYDFYMRAHADSIADKTNMHTVLHTHKGYKGVTHPCKETSDGKFVPNFEHRFLIEDIPFGLVPIRGIAEIVGVPSPMCDRIIQWAEKVLQKEYLVDGKLNGKDVANSSAPQNYGINSIDSLIRFYEY